MEATDALTLSLDEYRKLNFRPDVDYVEGFIQQRNLGDWDHSSLQAEFAFILGRNQNTKM